MISYLGLDLFFCENCYHMYEFIESSLSFIEELHLAIG